MPIIIVTAKARLDGSNFVDELTKLLDQTEERHTKRLRGLLARPECMVAPGVADAFAARLVARGF